MYIFVSDVHLSEPHTKRYGAFLHLMDKALIDSDIEEVFLVGDIFDLWVADRQFFINKHKSVLEKIRALAEKKKVHYFEGNHDFQLGKVWRDMGVHVYPAEAEFNIKDQKILVSHGDLLDKEDKGYLRLRWFFRTGFARFLISSLPVFILNAIGKAMITTDQKGEPTEEQKKNFAKKWSKWTHQLYSERKFDLFICGHYHFKEDLELEGGVARAINLGTWLGGDHRVLVLNQREVGFKEL